MKSGRIFQCELWCNCFWFKQNPDCCKLKIFGILDSVRAARAAASFTSNKYRNQNVFVYSVQDGLFFDFLELENRLPILKYRNRKILMDADTSAKCIEGSDFKTYKDLVNGGEDSIDDKETDPLEDDEPTIINSTSYLLIDEDVQEQVLVDNE